jgi:hypothetical protein
MVPPFPAGTRLVTADEDQLELRVTDRTCPPGFDDCLHCNQRWAQWLTDAPSEPWFRDVRPLRRSVDPIPLPSIPTLGVFAFDGFDETRELPRFRTTFTPWPSEPSPGATYSLINAAGVVGTTQPIGKPHHCGFLYTCWYGSGRAPHDARRPWFAIGPLDPRPTSVHIIPRDNENIEFHLDNSTHLRAESAYCFTVGPTAVSSNICFRSRLEHRGETWERLIGHTTAHHAQPFELCRRRL